MALGQRRMLYTNLWQNMAFSELSDKAKLLYIGLITVADDDGRLRANSLLLRSQVFPYDEKITQQDIRKWLNEVKKGGLIDFYSIEGAYFIQHPNWHKYQSIRKELYKSSNIPPNPTQKKPIDDTKKPHKLSKVKLSKEREEENAKSYLLNLPELDLEQFYNRFDCSKKQIISKGEQLFNYCLMHERWYKNYKAFLLNAIKGDFPERKEPPRKPVVQQNKPAEEEPDPRGTPIPQHFKDAIKKIIGDKKITL